MKRILVLMFLPMAGLCTAELLPRLETVANKQKEVAKTIFDERVNEVIKIQDPYIAEINAASLKATESGNGDLLKLLTAE